MRTINMTATLENIHKKVDEYNLGKPLKDQIRCGIITTMEVIVRQSIKYARREKKLRLSLKTTNQSLATLIHSNEKTVRRHIQRLEATGLLKKEESRDWFRFTLSYDASLLVFQEPPTLSNSPETNERERIIK